MPSTQSLLSTKFSTLVLVIFSITLILMAASLLPVQAEENDQEKISKKQDEIEAIQQELERVQGEKQTLASTLSYLESKAKLTQAQINQTESQLEAVQGEIQELTQKISLLDIDLQQISTLLVRRIGNTYKRSRINPFTLMLSHNDLSDTLSIYKYLQTSQKNDRRVLFQLETTRANFDTQKSLKEKKQLELDELHQQLDSQKASLGKQQKEKEYLLITTANDEKKFQQQLAQAYAEKAALEQALVSGVEVGPVKRGDVIGLVGNSGYPGCSTAKHLHFEIRKNNSWIDPGQYLESKEVKDEGFLDNHTEMVRFGSGGWPWPISDTIRLTQHYGSTPWSSRYKYSGGIHTGYDMNSTSSDVIKAPADGKLFKSSQACGSSTINIVYIDHGEDVLSFYLHVQ